MRLILGAMFVPVLLAGCGSDSESSGETKRACELLRLERDLDVPPPGSGTVSRSIGGYFTEFLQGGASNAIVYVVPEQADSAEAIADEVGAIRGVDVVELIDQAEMYEEFRSLFENSPQLIETVDPSVLPAGVRVDVSDDDALDAVLEWATDEPRVDAVVDNREIAAATFGSISREFDAELRELERLVDGELQDPIATLRTDHPSLGQVNEAVGAIGDFISEHCPDGS